ncbi:hypothetical protein GH714_010772 [Hevea brasiliensis]|uniref:Uncharacterized protein n=1 Tax=Hevea brasiliensis TaxID=3981 RepID=A0A6A6MM41_HEVBR|nr:hypothetical protein GH714_010772 [Hevea brasiliensis]
MNGKKGSFEINIPPMATKAKQQETEKNAGIGGFSCEACIWKVWEFAKEDSKRVTFSFKVGLSVLLVSLLILFQHLMIYLAPISSGPSSQLPSCLNIQLVCISITLMYHIHIHVYVCRLTYKCNVSATFNRGFDRALGSLLAGILAIAVGQLALLCGRVAEPIILGISIFLVGAITSFMKLWPSLVPYEYGFKVILFTYCLIIVSGYRMGNPIKTAMDRLYSIAIGGFVAVLVNVLVFPIWAGELLHEELVSSFNSVADSLEECVKKYLEGDGLDHPEFSKTVMDQFPDEPAYRKCRSTLNSSVKLESWANAAKWEPPHGRFRHVFYPCPWTEYVKVGAVLRYCAYEVMALHGVLHSEIQAPYNLRVTFQLEIQDAATQAAELVRNLGKDISDMKQSLKTSLLKKLSHTLSTNPYDLSNQLPELDSNSLAKNSDPLNQSTPSGTIPLEQSVDSYHEMMRKQSRRLYSWPSREVDAFEEEGGLAVDFLPRMRALESTAALSLATFTSLLIEFVARLDHLVEAVDELSKMAKFKHESV